MPLPSLTQDAQRFLDNGFQHEGEDEEENTSMSSDASGGLKRAASMITLEKDSGYKVTKFSFGSSLADEGEEILKEIYAVSNNMHVRVFRDPFSGGELRPGLVKSYQTKEGTTKDFRIPITFAMIPGVTVAFTKILRKKDRALHDLLFLSEELLGQVDDSQKIVQIITFFIQRLIQKGDVDAIKSLGAILKKSAK